MSDTPINPIDAIYDENNNDAIILMNDHGEEIPFEQIALIPIFEKHYVILKPMVKLDGIGEDEGLVFSIEVNDEGLEYLSLVVDEGIIDQIFDIYFKLLEDEEEE